MKLTAVKTQAPATTPNDRCSVAASVKRPALKQSTDRLHFSSQVDTLLRSRKCRKPFRRFCRCARADWLQIYFRPDWRFPQPADAIRYSKSNGSALTLRRRRAGHGGSGQIDRSSRRLRRELRDLAAIILSPADIRSRATTRRCWHCPATCHGRCRRLQEGPISSD